MQNIYLEKMLADKIKAMNKRLLKIGIGRIGLKNGTGSNRVSVAQLILERDYLLSKDEDVSFILKQRDLELKCKTFKVGGMNVKCQQVK